MVVILLPMTVAWISRNWQPGYTGAASGFAQYNGAPLPGSYAGYQQQPQHLPQQDPRYPTAHFSSSPWTGDITTRSPNMPTLVRIAQGMDPVTPTTLTACRLLLLPSQPIYATTAPSVGYPATTSPFNYPGQAPPSNPAYAPVHAADAGYGRGT